MSHATSERLLDGGPARPRRVLQDVPLSSVWTAACLALPLLINAGARLGTVDLTYHLRAGALMLDSGALIRTDSFTFTALGSPWLDQQWLSQVLLALAFRAGGWLGLALMRSLLAAVALTLVYAACRARGAARRGAAWLTLGSATLLLPTLQLRPQLFGVACFALTLWLLAGRGLHPRRCWLVVPLVMLWANLHGTFVLAIGLIGLAWLEDMFAAERHDTARLLVFVGLASIAASMVNPFGARVWWYVFALSTNPAVSTLVTEWQPTSVDSYSGAVFLVSVPLVVMLLLRTRASLRWPLLLAFGSFFVIGLLSVRGVYWWAMAVPVLLAGAGAGRAAVNRADPKNAFNALIIGTLGAALLIVLGRWLPFHSADPPPPDMVSQAPVGITRALRQTVGTGERIMSAQAWGSWLEFALPGNPVAVDSRIELFPASVWKRYGDVSNGREGWQATLDEWKVRVVVVYPVQQPELLARISRDATWTLAYRDDDGSVFVKK